MKFGWAISQNDQPTQMSSKMREFTNDLRTDNGDYLGLMTELFEVTHNLTDTLSTREILKKSSQSDHF
jgi:hypothetical protein